MRKELEKPYIKYNIDFTRKAFNIENIHNTTYVKNNLTQLILQIINIQ